MYKKIFLISSLVLFLLLFLGNITDVNARRINDEPSSAGWPDGLTLSQTILPGQSASFGIGTPSGAGLTSFLKTNNCNQYINAPVNPGQYPGISNWYTKANCAFTFDSSSFPSGLNSSYFDITKTGSLHNTSFVFKAHNAVPSGTYMFSATGFIHRWSTGPAPSRIGTQSVILKLTIRAPSAINGFCGLSNGKTFSSAPTSNLCSAGTASSVSGSGPWNWTCNGSNGGTNASCSANKILPTGTLNAKSASCVIPINGSSCPINFSWKTFNPVGTSAVTSSINDLGKSISTTVATINSTDLA